MCIFGWIFYRFEDDRVKAHRGLSRNSLPFSHKMLLSEQLDPRPIWNHSNFNMQSLLDKNTGIR